MPMATEGGDSQASGKLFHRSNSELGTASFTWFSACMGIPALLCGVGRIREFHALGNMILGMQVTIIIRWLCP